MTNENATPESPPQPKPSDIDRPWYVKEYATPRPTDITINKDHVINRQGRDFVLYQGLLNAAHRAGMTAIRTSLIQAPTSLNGGIAIVHATAEFPWGAYEGIGDADDGNVSRNIAPHKIRMAETRAKARALRDALDVGMAAVEELTGLPSDREAEEEDDEPAPARPAGRRPVAPPSREGPPPAVGQRAAPASREAEAEKYGKIMVTAKRLKESGALKVSDKEWAQLTAPFAVDADAAYISDQYQKVLGLVNVAVAKK